MSLRDRLGGKSKGKGGGGGDDGRGPSGGSELTPLQRYLARKASEQKEETFEDRQEARREPDRHAQKPLASESTETSPSLQSKPIAGEGFEQTPPPPPPASPPSMDGESLSRGPGPKELKPGHFWPRFGASVIDGLILKAVQWPCTKALVTTLAFGLPERYDFFSETLSYPVYLAIAFFYYGWFYSERGATPGKLVFDLELAAYPSGERIGYWRAFLRETLGKFISGFPLLLGFILAALRSDRRALHDLIFETRVISRASNQP